MSGPELKASPKTFTIGDLVPLEDGGQGVVLGFKNFYGVGDTVWLKSGGPEMTVKVNFDGIDQGDAEAGESPHYRRYVETIWFGADGRTHEQKFDPRWLTPYRPNTDPFEWESTDKEQERNREMQGRGEKGYGER